jgi:O-antigen ligase
VNDPVCRLKDARRFEFLCLALAVGLPLVSRPLTLLPPGWAPYGFRFVLPLAGLGAVVWLLLLANQARRGSLSPGGRLGCWLAGGLVVCAVLAVVFSRHFHLSVHMLPVVLSNLAVFLVASRFAADRLRTFCWCWLATAVVVALVGLGFLHLAGEAEFLSTFGNRNFAAAYLVTAVLIGTGVAVRSGCSIAERLAAAACCAVLMIGLYDCGSRGAWLALAGGVCFGWVCAGQSARSPMAGAGNGGGRAALRLATGWPARLILVTVALVGTVLWQREYISGQFETDVRPVIWRGTLRMAMDRPVLGHGLGVFQAVYPEYRLPEYFKRPKAATSTDHPHNELLETAAEQGAAGLVATLVVWIAALWRGVGAARRDGARRYLWLGVTGATAALLAHGMVDVNLRFAPNQALMWLLLGLLVGAGGDLASGQERLTVALRMRSERFVAMALTLACALGLLVSAVTQPVLAGYWEQRARMAERRSQPVEAITAAERALTFQPYRLELRYFLAGVLATWAEGAEQLGTREGRMHARELRKLAINECETLRAIASDYNDLNYRLARLYAQIEQPERAVPLLSRALRHNPYHAAARRLLAELAPHSQT